MPNRENGPDDLGEWGPVLENLQRRKQEARAMGGAEKIARQRKDGRMDARQRIDALLDQGSFRELGTLVGSRPRA